MKHPISRITIAAKSVASYLLLLIVLPLFAAAAALDSGEVP
jgi:hypothetical protein